MEEEKKTNGAFVGLLIIIIILIVGGIYIWQSKVKSTLEAKKTQPELVVTPMDTNELNSLEQDINNTDTTVNVDPNTIN
jgi:predicted negative regulator of RcsB-dependent stress response